MIQLNPSNLAISGFRFSHHSGSSGYLPLAQHLPGTVIDSSKLINLIDHPLAARVAFGVFDLYLLAIQNRFQLIHHLYPELHLFWSSHRQTQVKIVATIHLPVEIIVDYKKDGKADPIRKFIYLQRYHCFSKLSGIITLTKKQNSEIEYFFPNIKVRFIPHGVNRKEQYVKFYDKQPNQVSIVCIGWNFRDFEMYREIVDYCLQEKPHWQFHLVGTLPEWQGKRI